MFNELTRGGEPGMLTVSIQLTVASPGGTPECVPPEGLFPDPTLEKHYWSDGSEASGCFSCLRLHPSPRRSFPKALRIPGAD